MTKKKKTIEKKLVIGCKSFVFCSSFKFQSRYLQPIASAASWTVDDPESQANRGPRVPRAHAEGNEATAASCPAEAGNATSTDTWQSAD
jgi:hypothetical protein